LDELNNETLPKLEKGSPEYDAAMKTAQNKTDAITKLKEDFVQNYKASHTKP
jgi:hypothetical protein